MRALIAEDEPHLAADLERRLRRLWPELESIATVHDGLAARAALTDRQADVAFLDIRMPGLSGLEAARAAPSDCRVVFVTAHEEHAVAAFEQAAVDYLLKPVADARLEKCIARLRAPAPQPDLARLAALLAPSRPAPIRLLRALVGQEVHLVPVEEVCYFQAADKYTTARTRDRDFLLRTPIKELQGQLDPELFWQVHRGILVNIRQIQSARRDALGCTHLLLRDRPETLPVSRAYAHLFRQM